MSLSLNPQEVAHYGPRVARLLAAMRRAVPRLPADMRESFAALLSPTSLAVTAGCLVAWAGSHLVGIGELADFGMLAYGYFTLGALALEAARHLKDFLVVGSSAESDQQLDAAAGHLARAVALIGPAVFISLVFKVAGKAAPRVNRTLEVRIRPRLFKFMTWSLEEWTYKLGRIETSPRFRTGLEAALRYFAKRESLLAKWGNEPRNEALGYLKAMDLSKDVVERRLPAGTEVVGYMRRIDPALPPGPTNMRVGSFFTDRGTSQYRLGITPDGRYFCRFRLKADVTVLESKAAPFKMEANGQKHMVQGGGTQYILMESFDLFQAQVLEIVHVGQKAPVQSIRPRPNLP